MVTPIGSVIDKKKIERRAILNEALLLDSLTP